MTAPWWEGPLVGFDPTKPLSRSTPPKTRILARLVQQPNGCWHWTGVLDANGYGRIGYNGRRATPLQQAVYREFVGPIPDGMVPDHTCHTTDLACAGGRDCLHRRCGNPEHLELVTAAENVARGRSFGGTNANKTHCPKGHPYDAKNTYRSGGRRYCATCFALRHGYRPTKETVA